MKREKRLGSDLVPARRQDKVYARASVSASERSTPDTRENSKDTLRIVHDVNAVLGASPRTAGHDLHGDAYAD